MRLDVLTCWMFGGTLAHMWYFHFVYSVAIAFAVGFVFGAAREVRRIFSGTTFL